MKFFTYTILSTLIVAFLSTLAGILLSCGLNYWSISSSGNSMGVGGGVALFIFILIALHNFVCGLFSATITFNSMESVRNNIFLSFLSFFWYALFCLPLLLSKDIGTLLFLVGVLPFVVVQFINFVYFRHQLRKNRIKI